MPRTGLYVPLDVAFADDDKIEEVGLEGAGLYALSLAVAKRAMTDGRLTRTKLRRLGASDELIDRMVAVGLYTPDVRVESARTLPDAANVRADACETVWITAWLDHNDSAEQIEERRARDAARKRRTRANRPRGQGPDSDRTPTGRADTVEGREGKTEGTTPLSSQSEPTTRPQAPADRDGRARAACEAVGTRAHGDREAAGQIRASTPTGIDKHRQACIAGAMKDHLDRARRLAHDHPDWTPDRIADELTRASVPLEQSQHPAVVLGERAKARERAEAAPVASDAHVRSAADDARRALAGAPRLAVVADQ